MTSQWLLDKTSAVMRNGFILYKLGGGVNITFHLRQVNQWLTWLETAEEEESEEEAD